MTLDRQKMRSQFLVFTLIALLIGATNLAGQDVVRHLSQQEAVKAAVVKPEPEYPPVARQLRIQGRIELEISIDPAGSVDSVKVLAGNPALTGTASNTLKRWRFEPITAGGKPVRAVAVLSFAFKL
jgi:TonB family protein